MHRDRIQVSSGTVLGDREDSNTGGPPKADSEGILQAGGVDTGAARNHGYPSRLLISST